MDSFPSPTEQFLQVLRDRESTIAYQLADSCESFKVSLLRRHQRVRFEVWQHLGYQFADVPNFELESLV